MRVQQYYVVCPKCNSTKLSRKKRRFYEKIVHYGRAKLHCTCGTDFYIRDRKAA